MENEAQNTLTDGTSGAPRSADALPNLEWGDGARFQTCAWHANDDPVHPSIGCDNCGTMIDTADCKSCGKTFIDWESRGYDDVIAGAYVTMSGDLACMRCGPRRDRESEEAEDDNYYQCDDRY